MPVILEANYSKTIGLPHYSSHKFSLTVKVELGDLNKIAEESTRLYGLLQECVDHDLQQTGYLPEGNGHSNGHSNGHANGQPCHPNGHTNGRSSSDWKCTPKQRDLILKLVEDNGLPKEEIEQLAQERFSKGVKALNKLEASGLIEELIERHPQPPERNGRTTTRRTYQRSRA
jgi:hypothetical protein